MTEVAGFVVLSAEQARVLTDRIRTTLQVGHALIIEAFQGSAWSVLGYGTWDAYCAGEFAGARMVRLDREQRREIVAEMRQAGMSSRAIASSLGVDQKTVINDLPAGEESSSPALITGTDGKTYPAPAPRPQEPINEDESVRCYPEGAARSNRNKPKTPPAEFVLQRVLMHAQKAATEAESMTPAQLARVQPNAAPFRDGISQAVEALQRLLTQLTEETS